MNSKVMNKVLSFLLVAAVAFTTIFTPVNAATVNSRDKKLKGKIKEMHVYDGLTEIANKDTIQMAVGATKTLTIEFVDKSEKKAATHQVVAKSNNKKAVAATADYDKDLNESVVTLAVDATAKAGDKATVTIKSKAKKVKTVKFNVEVIEMVPVTGVTLDNTAPKVGDTINAKLVPENADTEGLTYKWEALATADAAEGTALGTSSSVVISANEVGKFIKLTVADAEGKTYTATTTAAVKEDNTASVTVYDKNGAQSDGTGLTTDTLALSYGSGLGVPALITWYCNDVVVKSLNANAGQIQAILELDVTADNAGKAGTYFATITNTENKEYRSNDFTVVYDQLAAEISGITISDDLKSAANIAYNKNDDKAVITMNMKKFYDGKYYLYESTLENYSTSNYTALLDTDNLTKGGEQEMKTFDKMTEGNAIKYDDVNYDYIVYYAPNGETTVMWETTAALTRGKSYKLVFDQKELKTDDIGATARKDVTPTEPAEVAYLTAPAGVELVTVTPGSPATARLIDEAGTTVSYIGDATNGTTIDNAGFGSVKVLGNTAATKTGATSKATGVSVKAGVIETGDLGDADYYYAEVKTRAGVYGKDVVTLESPFKASNVDIVKEIELTENATTPEQADVKLKGVVSAAKVYVVDTQSPNYIAAGGFNPADSSTYISVADVKAGDATASLDSIFNDESYGHEFIAWIVPEDEGVYARQSSKAFTLKHIATSLEYDADGAVATFDDTAATTPANTYIFTGNTEVAVKDQFGKTIADGTNFDAVTSKTATVKAINDCSDHAENYTTGSYEIVDGNLKISVAEDAATDIKDGFEVTVLGSTLTFKAQNYVAASQDDSAKYEIKLGANTVQAGTPGTSLNVQTVAGLENAVSIANSAATALAPVTVTIASTKKLSLSKDLTIGENVELVVSGGAVGDVLTVPAGITLTNQGTLVIKGDATNAATFVNNGVYVSDGGTLTLETATQSGSIAASTGEWYMDTTEQIANLNGNAGITGEIHATGSAMEIDTWATTAAKFIVDSGAKVSLKDTKNDTFVGGLEINGEFVGTKTTSGTTTIANTKTLTVAPSAKLTGAVFTTGTGGTETYTLTDGTSTVTIEVANDATTAANNTRYNTRTSIETNKASNVGTSKKFTVEVDSGVVYLTIAR